MARFGTGAGSEEISVALPLLCRFDSSSTECRCVFGSLDLNAIDLRGTGSAFGDSVILLRISGCISLICAAQV